VSEIEVGVTLQQFDADLSRIFEDDQDSADDDVRVPIPRPPSEDSDRPHLQLAPAVPELVIESVRGSLGLPAKIARSPWTTDLPTASVAALVVGFAAQMPASLALGVLAVWAASAFRAGSALNSPGTPVWRGLAAALSPPVASAGLAVAVLGTPSRTVAVATLMVLVATMSVLILRSLRVTRPIRAVVLGDGIGIAEAAARWQGHGQIKIVGGCSAMDRSDSQVPGDLGWLPWVHGSSQLGALVDDTHAELVLVAPGATGQQLREVAWQLEERPVRLAVIGPLDSVAPHRLTTTSFAGTTLMHVASSRPSALTRTVKSGLDRCAGLALLVAAAPVIAVLAVLIRLDSPGSAMFRQTRVGEHGGLFTIYKLRTMTDDAEARRAELVAENEVDGHLFKIRSDPRVTRLGKFLRRSSLDELPQLINVVKGEMSIIGPRPALPDEVAQYDAVTRRRLAVKPGITGLWQVSGRSDLPYDEAVRLDLHYTDNWRLSDDAVIVLRTVSAVGRGNGAW
jgi:exopolysaccharide biosynthesis polyprenyl glycosylphosphotransferase